MARDIRIHPKLNSTTANDFPRIDFGGLSASTISMKVDDDGSVVYTGTYGVLFNVTDDKDGLLHSVNDVSGLPILQVYSWDYVQMGKWDKNTLVVNSDKVGVGLTAPSTKLEVSGQTRIYRNGTYSYFNLGYNSSFEGQYLTNSTSAANVNVGVYGLAKPSGLQSHSDSFFMGVAGVAIYDGDTSFTTTGGSDVNARIIGVQGLAGHYTSGGGTAQGVIGVQSTLLNTTTGFTQSNAIAFRASWNNSLPNNGWTTNYYGFYMVDDYTNGLAPNVTNRWGIYIDDVQAHNVFMGTVSIGSTSKVYKLRVNGSSYLNGDATIGDLSSSYVSAQTGTVSIVGGYLKTTVNGYSDEYNYTVVEGTSTIRHVMNIINTTSGTTQTLCSFSASSPKSYVVWGTVIGRDTGGNSTIGGRVDGVFNWNGFTASVVGVSSTIHENFTGTPTFTLAVIGSNTIALRVTGLASTSIDWTGHLYYMAHSTWAP